MKECTNGHNNADGAVVCGTCGEQFPADSTPPEDHTPAKTSRGVWTAFAGLALLALVLSAAGYFGYKRFLADPQKPQTASGGTTAPATPASLPWQPGQPAPRGWSVLGDTLAVGGVTYGLVNGAVEVPVRAQPAFAWSDSQPANAVPGTLWCPVYPDHRLGPDAYLMRLPPGGCIIRN